MISNPEFSNRILLIAGTGRNTGKTTLACDLIRHFAKEHDINAVKITSIYPDENEAHGTKNQELGADFEIIDDTDTQIEKKDTYRMKMAGAKRVFFVRTKDDQLQESVIALFEQIDEGSLVVCESASLRKVLTPGVFIMIRSNDESKIKERARKLFYLADFLLVSENYNTTEIATALQGSTKGWQRKAMP